MMLSELFPENKETEEERKKTVTTKSSDIRSACETLPKKETEEGPKPSGVSPFECAQHCVFAGRYLGLEENKDYKTLRAVFKVDNYRVCNKEIVTYFDRIRQADKKEEKAKRIKVRFLLVIRNKIKIICWY